MIKDVPMQTLDGVQVKVGAKIYTVGEKYFTSYRNEKETPDRVKTGSGKSRAYLEENEVIHTNQASNARTFTLRSPRGCEFSYSVRDSCLKNVFGKRINAVKAKRKIDLADSHNIKAKIAGIEKHISERKAAVLEWKAADKKLMTASKKDRT